MFAKYLRRGADLFDDPVVEKGNAIGNIPRETHFMTLSD